MPGHAAATSSPSAITFRDDPELLAACAGAVVAFVGEPCSTIWPNSLTERESNFADERVDGASTGSEQFWVVSERDRRR